MKRALLAGLSLLASACASNPDPAPVAVAAPSAAPLPAPAAPAPVMPPVAAPVIAAPVVTAPAATPAPAAASAPARRTLEQYIGELKAVSCPSGVRREQPADIDLKVSKVPLSPFNPMQKRLGELEFVAGFSLTSSDDRFGGLSGLDILPDGNLLAISDVGDFVWVDLAKDELTPEAARIGSMRNSAGDVIRGKADGDAEGLAVHPSGWALVSYERNDRVLAYDLKDCGVAARGAPVFGGARGDLRGAYRAANMDVGDNSGPEPLAVTDDWFVFVGSESLNGDRGPLSARPIEAAADFSLSIERGAPAFVGLDLVPQIGGGVRAFSVHRGIGQGVNTAIIVSESDFARDFDQANAPRRIDDSERERARYSFRATSTKRLAQFSVLQTLDNYESVAARPMSDGRVRLYLMSDNNFSTSQRTLLMIFDLR